MTTRTNERDGESRRSRDDRRRDHGSATTSLSLSDAPCQISNVANSRHVSRTTRFFPVAQRAPSAPDTSCFARSRTRAHLARARTRPRSVHEASRTPARARASRRRSSRDAHDTRELSFLRDLTTNFLPTTATMLLSVVSRTAKRAGTSDPNAAFDALRRERAARVARFPHRRDYLAVDSPFASRVVARLPEPRNRFAEKTDVIDTSRATPPMRRD